LVVLVAGLGNAAAQTPAATLADALAIYDRTRAVVAARSIPPFIAYTQDAELIRHGKRRVERARIVLRMSDGKANVTPLAAGSDRPTGGPHVEERPLVNPTTTFGLVRRRANEAPSAYEPRSTPMPESSDSPTVIGHVKAANRDYDPRLVGTEILDGSPVYHLALVPRADPEHHPIRDLYVDTQTYQPRRMAIEVYAEAGPIHSRPTATVDFAPVDGTWLIDHASMDFVLRFAFFAYGGSGEFQISDVGFPPSEPDWLFDARGLSEHANASPAPTASSSGAPF
jgi:hypothetical protein